MTRRDDLEELHALAASISDETHGWRAHRRVRSQAAAQARTEAEMVAPVKRRRRHRVAAIAGVALVAIMAVTLVITLRPGKPNPPQQRTIVTVRHQPSQVRAGQKAAIALQELGRTANLFACQGWYQSEGLGAVAIQNTTQWRQGFLTACASG